MLATIRDLYSIKTRNRLPVAITIPLSPATTSNYIFLTAIASQPLYCCEAICTDLQLTVCSHPRPSYADTVQLSSYRCDLAERGDANGHLARLL